MNLEAASASLRNSLLDSACPRTLKAFSGCRTIQHSRRRLITETRAAALDDGEPSDTSIPFGRRKAVLTGLTAAGLALCTSPKPATAGPYTDERDNYKIDIPDGWTLNEGNNAPGTGPTATRRTLAWFEPGNETSYVTVVVTNVGADYTSLGSFGTAEQFGSNLVGGMDQSFLKRAPKWARGKGAAVPQEAKLIKASESDRAYNIEYIIKRSEDDERHLLSTVAIGYNGRYTRLYTVTAQCTASRLQGERPVLQGILNSFKAPYARS